MPLARYQDDPVRQKSRGYLHLWARNLASIYQMMAQSEPCSQLLRIVIQKGNLYSQAKTTRYGQLLTEYPRTIGTA